METETLNEVLEHLDDVMKKMEDTDVSLEEAFQLYHEGMHLLKVCNDKIDTIEKKMLILDGEGNEHEF